MAAPVADRERSPAASGWRRTAGRLVVIAITLVAIGGVLGQIGSFGDIVAAVRRAHWGWVAAALVCSALTSPMAALGVRAGLGVDVPLRRVTSLQLASKFANLVTPAGIGATALNVKFMARHGAGTASAITSDVTTSVVSGIGELALVAVCAWRAGGRFRADDLPAGTGRAVVIAIVVLGVVVAVVARVPKLRTAVMPHARRAWQTIVDLARAPRRTLVIAASAMAVSALFALCLGLSLRAYGAALPLTTLILVNWAATTVGSISPTPGGLGVAEAGLVAGLTAAGVPTDVAVAAALTHRLLTFWLPPVPGWFAIRALERAGHV